MTIRRARRDFNVSLQPLTEGKWSKLLWKRGASSGRPRSNTDAATTGRILEAFYDSPQKSTRSGKSFSIELLSNCCNLKNYLDATKSIAVFPIQTVDTHIEATIQL